MTRTLWGVGALSIGDAVLDYPVSIPDMERDVAAAVKTLDSLGVKAGSRVLLISLLSEATLYWPVLCALVARGAQVSCADATAADAARVGMLLARLRYDAVAGIAAETVEGLGQAGVSALRNAPLLAARPGAHERLAAAGMSPRRWVHAGPALGVECEARAGAHVDGGEWELAVDEGMVLVSARRPRAEAIAGLETGIAGSIAAARCECGRDDPRIVPREP